MANKIIQHLKDCIENDSSLEVLLHQWGFDEKLVPKALQNIGNLFTHYSRHDESHSKQILINIERLLGDDRIKLLTATDSWLLLESAYWHDVGMVVTRKEYEIACRSIEFTNYILEIKNDKNHPLNNLCDNFNIKDKQWNISTDVPYDMVTKFRELFAEWFRRKHSERSNEIIQMPWEKTGLSSPRTELIPSRLFLILGKICQLHGCDFKKIISEEELPYRQVGIGTENCHPRYVACLLRLGDLLDLDNNRFCPVMVQIAGDNRPNLSKVHESKHRSIINFRLDSKIIDVTSVCDSSTPEENIDVYIETTKWFNFIKNEVKNQMINWSRISPNKKLGLLPVVGNLSIKFKNENIFIPEENIRPQFSVNTDKAIKILQSIYSDKYSSISELVQNSVDSILIRMFEEHKNDKDFNSIENGDLDKLNLYLSHYEIKVSLKNKVEDVNDNGFEHWELEIKDNGCGISINDFRYMMKIGGSSNNIPRKIVISNMPDIIKPIGTFGIGFQSVFLLSDKVKVRTKSFFSDECNVVTMYNPLSDRAGLCIFEKTTDRINYGTSITFDISIKKDFHLKYNQSKSGNMINKARNEFDRYLDDNWINAQTFIMDKICESCSSSMVSINISMFENGEESNIINVPGTISNRGKDWRFVHVDNLLILYKISLDITNGGGRKNIFFKGKKVASPHSENESYINRDFLTELLLYNVDVDILTGNSEELLTPDRERIRDENYQLIEKMYIEIVNNYFLSKSATNTDKVIISILSNYNYKVCNDIRWVNLSNAFEFEWKKYYSSLMYLSPINESNIDNILMKDGFSILLHKTDMIVNGKFTQIKESSKNMKDFDLGVIVGGKFHNEWVKLYCYYRIIIKESMYEADYDVNQNDYIYRFYNNSCKNKLTVNYIASIFLRELHTIGSINIRPIVPDCDLFDEKFDKILIDFESFHELGMTSDDNRISARKFYISPIITRRNPKFNNDIIHIYTDDRFQEFCNFLIVNKLVNLELTELMNLYKQWFKRLEALLGKSQLSSEWNSMDNSFSFINSK